MKSFCVCGHYHQSTVRMGEPPSESYPNGFHQFVIRRTCTAFPCACARFQHVPTLALENDAEYDAIHTRFEKDPGSQ